MKSLMFLLSLLIASTVLSQETVGLLSYSNNAYDGYTLFTPESSKKVYLIDNCGNKINSWEFSENPGLTCYLLENGELLRAGRNKIEIRDWNNTLVWEFNINSNLGVNQHHDIEPLPNGNILCLIKDIIPVQQQEDLGKNPALIQGDLKSEKIIELKPIGSNQAQIVWEWRFIDRIIQDYSPSASNTFGNVAQHPERIDFNYDIDGFGDHINWVHANSITYNADLDQILISCRNLGEIYIIDHSTTTLEASGHIGGNYNKGGDFLWRWGNPEAYRQGQPSNRKLFGHHDAKWIPNTYPDSGKISIFNNSGDGSYTYSSVHIINPTIETNGNYAMLNNTFLPSNFFYTWNGNTLPDTVTEAIKSGVNMQPNGNFLICETSKGNLREFTRNGNLVWYYKNPVANDVVQNQYETINPTGSNSMFRGEKYPKDFPGFNNKDLQPKGTIENLNTNSGTCNQNLSTVNTLSELIQVINPVQNHVIFNKTLNKIELKIYNNLGQLMYKNSSFSGNKLELDNFPSSNLYYIQLKKENSVKVIKFIKL